MRIWVHGESTYLRIRLRCDWWKIWDHVNKVKTFSILIRHVTLVTIDLLSFLLSDWLGLFLATITTDDAFFGRTYVFIIQKKNEPNKTKQKK